MPTMWLVKATLYHVTWACPETKNVPVNNSGKPCCPIQPWKISADWSRGPERQPKLQGSGMTAPLTWEDHPFLPSTEFFLVLLLMRMFIVGEVKDRNAYSV